MARGLLLEDLENVGGLFGVMGQADYPGSVFNQEQIMDAPRKEDVRSLIVSATGGVSGGPPWPESCGRS